MSSDNNSKKNPGTAAENTTKTKTPTNEIEDATDQRQLQEFNEWLVKWNSYQERLAKYWTARAWQTHAQLPAQGQGQSKQLVYTVGGAQVSGKSARWDVRFQELCDYKREHGNCNVPTNFLYKYKPPLGVWVKSMRRLYKDQKLDPQKAMRLSDIGFEWSVKDSSTIKFSALWHKSYLKLKAYREEHGDVEVPAGYTGEKEGGKQLDNWIGRQRRLFRDEKLPTDLIDKLEQLGVNLKGRGRPFGYESEESWNSNYDDMMAYYEQHGNCDVAESTQLGEWAKKQREFHKSGTLSEDRIEKLTEIGFNFFIAQKLAISTDPWETRLNELKAFKDATGHMDVPRLYALNVSLPIWVRNQRLAYAEKKLSMQQIKSLKDLGFSFAPPKAKPSEKTKLPKLWERNFQELAKYKEENSNCNVKGICAANPRIGGWLKRQKKYYRENGLEQSRVDRLKALGVQFDTVTRKTPLNVPWEMQYEALLEYKSKHGDINVPSTYPANQSLYYWIGTQRAYYKKNKLSEERIGLLNAIGFDFSPEPATTGEKRKETPKAGKGFLNPKEFDHYYQKLVEYKEKTGDTNVPQRYEEDRLGSFVHYMRLYLKVGKLSQEQETRLKEIGFDFNVQESLWNTRCKELAEYKENHGDFFVSYTDNPTLHQWKNSQIKRYNDGTLTNDQLEKLMDIDFDFVKLRPKTPKMKTPKKADATSAKKEQPIGLMVESDPAKREQYLQELWDASYEKLSKVAEETGNCDIPLKYDADPSLAAWCFAQKMAKKKDKLSEERVSKLEQLGFKF